MLTGLLHRIVSHPAVYDMVQTLFGAKKNLKKIKALMASGAGVTVLDVGAGTGNGMQVVPDRVRYLWLDNDAQKLAGLPRTGPRWWAILASATAIPLRDQSVDTTLCMAMSHHLDDRQVVELFSELARVCRGRLIFFDAVDRPDSLKSRLMWKYDRGSHPRRVATLRKLIQERFQIDHEEEYSIYHHYWLCSATSTSSKT